MSSGEEFEVAEILDQRKRKGVLEYLVRWQGFNNLYDSWEPASGIAHCTSIIKAFLEQKKRSRSKSRSRSRGRKSKSRSRSRGRQTKSASYLARSRSRSASRKTPQSSSKSSYKSFSEVADIAEKGASSAEQNENRRQIRSRVKVTEKVETKKKAEITLGKSSTTSEGGILERRTEVEKLESVETVRSIPASSQSTAMSTRSRLVVRQVENDQKETQKKSTDGEEKEMWLWGFADHIVLILFVIISLIALLFAVSSAEDIREKLIPDLGVLRERLSESYDQVTQALSHGLRSILEIFPSWGVQEPAESSK